EVEVLLVTACALDHLADRSDVVGMDAGENHLDRRFDRGVVPEDPEAFLRPGHLSGRYIPPEASREAQLLRFGQVSRLTALQGRLGPLALGDVGVALERPNRLAPRVLLLRPAAGDRDRLAVARGVQELAFPAARARQPSGNVCEGSR